MLSDYLNKVKNNNSCYLVKVRFENSGLNLFCVELSYNNEEIKVFNSGSFNTFNNEMFSFLKKDVPILLHIEGDKVLSKEVENKIGYRKNVLFKANPDEFFFMELHQKEKIYVSYIRNHEILNILDHFNSNDKFISQVTIGPFIIAMLFPLLEQNSFWSSNYVIITNNNKVASFTKNDDSERNYKISNEIISADLATLYACLMYFKFSKEELKIDYGFLKKNIEQSHFKRMFKLSGKVALISVLLLIVFGHFYLNNTLKSLADKQAHFSVSQSSMANLNKIKAERDLKENVLAKSGIANKEYYAKYISQISDNLFDEITLVTFDVFPLSQKIKDGEKVELLLKEINVEGITNSDLAFNKWLKELESLDWIESYNIINYSDEGRLDNFKLKLLVK